MAKLLSTMRILGWPESSRKSWHSVKERKQSQRQVCLFFFFFFFFFDLSFWCFRVLFLSPKMTITESSLKRSISRYKIRFWFVVLFSIINQKGRNRTDGLEDLGRIGHEESRRKSEKKKNQGRIILLMVGSSFLQGLHGLGRYLLEEYALQRSFVSQYWHCSRYKRGKIFFFSHSIFLLCKKDVVNKAAEAFGMPEVKSHLQLFVRTGLKDAKVLSD